jgi:hypothetical protein
MKLREKLNDNPAITTAGAALVLTVCVGLLIWQFMGGQGSSQSYYLDLNTNEIFVAKTALPPVEAPSGKTDEGELAGVAARIFACGQCSGSYAGMTPQQVADAGAELSSLQRRPDAPQQAENSNSNMPAGLAAAFRTEVALPGDREWAKINSDAGQQIIQSNLNCTEDQSVTPCHPE